MKIEISLEDEQACAFISRVAKRKKITESQVASELLQFCIAKKLARGKVACHTPQNMIPSWVPLDLWYAFCKARHDMGKPLSALAEKRALKKMQELTASGDCAAKILTQSIELGYMDLYPTKGFEKRVQDKKSKKFAQESLALFKDLLPARKDGV